MMEKYSERWFYHQIRANLMSLMHFPIWILKRLQKKMQEIEITKQKSNIDILYI